MRKARRYVLGAGVVAAHVGCGGVDEPDSLAQDHTSDTAALDTMSPPTCGCGAEIEALCVRYCEQYPRCTQLSSANLARECFAHCQARVAYAAAWSPDCLQVTLRQMGCVSLQNCSQFVGENDSPCRVHDTETLRHCVGADELFECGTGELIRVSSRCDGERDCSNAADEAACPP